MHVERVRSTLCHPSSTSTGRIAAHSPWSRRTPLAHEASCALALRRLQAFWDQLGSQWDENALERLITHRLTPSALHQDRIAKAAAAEAQGASWFDG